MHVLPGIHHIVNCKECLTNTLLGNQGARETIELSLKSCPVGPELHPSFDASSPLGCCPQSHENLLNKGLKYWDSRLNAGSSRTFIATVHIHQWLLEGVHGKKGQGELSLTPNLVLNSVSCPLKPSVFFPLFFEISFPMWPNRGFQCLLFLTLRITSMFYEYDQWIHGYTYIESLSRKDHTSWWQNITTIN